MKRPKTSCNAVESPAAPTADLLAEMHALLDRIPPAGLAELAANLRNLAVPPAVGPKSGPTPPRKDPDARPRALIIDADPAAAELTADIVTSLDHEYDVAASQTEARALVAARKYAYVLLDLAIPVRKDRNHARIQHGVNLLREILRSDRMAGVPVITTLAEDLGSTDTAVYMMREGAADFLRKPFADTGYTLEKAIADALARARGERPTVVWPGALGRTKKRANRATAIEAVKNELVEHIRSARHHARAAADQGKGPELLPRPLKKDLARLLGLKAHTVTRCFQDRPELRVLWEAADDLDQVMKLGR